MSLDVLWGYCRANTVVSKVLSEGLCCGCVAVHVCFPINMSGVKPEKTLRYSSHVPHKHSCFTQGENNKSHEELFEVIGKFHRPLMQGINVAPKKKASLLSERVRLRLGLWQQSQPWVANKSIMCACVCLSEH